MARRIAHLSAAGRAPVVDMMTSLVGRTSCKPEMRPKKQRRKIIVNRAWRKNRTRIRKNRRCQPEKCRSDLCKDN